MHYPSAMITGVGSFLPERVMSNRDLESLVETSDAWIRERTGIEQRHIAGEGETTSQMATKAALEAMKQAGIDDPASIDLIIVATSTPDFTMPSTACLVQAAIGNHHATALDLNAACSGFVFALKMAYGQIRSGLVRRALIIGAESMSRIIDWSDRTTCVLFGDGAGAVILEAGADAHRGILGCATYSDGAHHAILGTNGGVSSNQQSGVLSMQGQEVFRHGVEKMADAAQQIMGALDLTLDDIDWIIPHQANLRIVSSIAKRLKAPMSKFVITLNRHANTSAASIPLALAHAQQQGLLQPNNILALPALGAGLTWGCCIIRW